MTKDEALKLAIQLLDTPSGYWTEHEIPIIEKLIEILAQPEQEPVIDKSAAIRIATSLGWSPQRTWVGLTNNDLQPIAEEYRILFGSWVHDFARAIEAKLKEKNNG